MKKIYEKPMIDIEAFEVEDIITLSTASEGTGDVLSWDEITDD